MRYQNSQGPQGNYLQLVIDNTMLKWLNQMEGAKLTTMFISLKTTESDITTRIMTFLRRRDVIST